MDALQAYTAFVRTFEAGSFSAVAREMGISQSGVSKQIAALESSLGVQLFARTTRRLQPTAEALKLYEHVRQLLNAVEHLKASSGKKAVASGTLRVTMPSSYAQRKIIPKLDRFMAEFPEVELDIHLTDEIVDLVEEGLELGVRIGHLAASTLMARPIGISEQMLVASPEYLEINGWPEVPGDLASHSCVLYGSSTRWTRWEFESETGRHAVEVKGPVRVNDPDALAALVLAHRGIAMIPDWAIEDEIRTGKVKWLLQDSYPIPAPINIVYPQTRFLSQRARSFIDYFVNENRTAS